MHDDPEERIWMGEGYDDMLFVIDEEATDPTHPVRDNEYIERFAVWLGAKVRRVANDIARRRGLGPSAIAQKLEPHVWKLYYRDDTGIERDNNPPSDAFSDPRAVAKMCWKLIEYTRK